MTPALTLRGVSKRFGRVEALRNVDFTLERGEIHALLGENGAGKSTLMKIAFGMMRPDHGAIEVGGAPARLRSPVDARRHGIGMVHQHFTSIPAFTVAENVALAAGWAIQPPLIRERLTRLSERTGLDLDPLAQVEDLSAGLKQRLEVLKALATDASILLLDEPSSVLSPGETVSLLELVKSLRDQGVSSVLITHKLSEALAVADRVTVLRRGQVVHSGAITGQRVDTLATLMLGEGGPERPTHHVVMPGPLQVEAVGLSRGRLGRSGSGLHEATFTARAGEIVGVAAIEGNGQRELLRVLAGRARPDHGTLLVARPTSFVPEDRTTEGIIGDFSLTENLVLSQGSTAPWMRGLLVDWASAARRTQELLETYAVRASTPQTAAATLSGGNQQRLIIAEALERAPKVLIAENPTRGLDLRATAEVHDRLRGAAGSGVTVIVHLADLDELLHVADRIIVIAAGVLTELPPGTPRDQIGKRLLGAAPR